MERFLSILLLITGAASTLAAFGGKTWIEGTEPIVERITPRGWISLVCLLLALGVGVCKELYSSNQQAKKDAEVERAATKARTDADKRQTELKNSLKTAQDRIELANTKLELANTKLELSSAKLDTLKEQAKTTQDQITGGNGFPVAIILALYPDNGSFPLWVMPHGDAPLSNVSYKVMEGAYKSPTPEELKQMVADAAELLTGHRGDIMHNLGVLNPGKIVPMGYTIHPSMTGISTYRILFDARNGMVMETMEVRFNSTVNTWQYRFDIKSQDPRTPNKVLQKEDWQPEKQPHMLFGEGPPHN